MIENNQTAGSKSKRGGARKNAGRKKGAATTKTREIADKVILRAKKGGTPLEVMLKVMTGLMDAAEEAKKSDDADVKKSAVKLLVLAKDAASAAAPYVHPRLAAIEHTGKDGKDLIPATAGVLMVPMPMSEEAWETMAKGDGSAG